MMKLDELAERIGAELKLADPSAAKTDIEICAPIAEARPGQIAFLANPKYAEFLQSTQATAVIVGPEVTAEAVNLLVSDDPYFAFRNAMVALTPPRTVPEPGVHDTAIIDPSVTIDPTCSIGAYAIIEAGVSIGPRSIVYPHAYIGHRVTIGEACVLFPNVCIYEDCVLGDRVTLHAGCVVGQDGFGYATAQGGHQKIPQAGHAIIEDDVEMGANCSVDRATMGATVIGAGTKFSNSVTIGHGSKIGKANLYVAQVGVAGSCDIGDYVAMGGQVGVANHVRIGSKVRIAATSGVMDDIPEDTDVGGTPARQLTEAKRLYLASLRLPDLVTKIKQLERRLAKLEKEQ